MVILSAGQSHWYCGSCKEVLESSFDVCWSCGGARTEVGSPMPQEIAQLNSPTKAAQSDAPGLTHDLEAGESEADKIALRAWQSALLGMLIPIFATVYSTYLVFKVCVKASELSVFGRNRFLGAVAINALVWMFYYFYFAQV